MTEANDFKTSILLLLAVHYIFNLSYNIKARDFFLFLQEKVLTIPSDIHTKCKLPIGLAHTMEFLGYLIKLKTNFGL